MRLPPLSFAVFDTETTGMMPRVHHVIEFASMRAEGGKLTDTFEQLFGVKEEIPPHVQVLTRIRPADIEGKASFKDSLALIDEKLAGVDILVGQNLAFDLGMLKGEGLDLTHRPWVDTSLLASVTFPEFRSYSLQYMSTQLKLKHEPVHRALGDVRATFELLTKIWERLCELPQDELQVTKDIMMRTSEGYRMFFEALPESTSKDASWIIRSTKEEKEKECDCVHMEKPAVGTVELQEEGLHQTCLQCIVNGAAKDMATKRWIVVKNLESTLRYLTVPEGVIVIHPPQLLLNPEAADALLHEEKLTPEEGTLLLKLRWFAPRTRAEVPVHGNEKDIWNGTLACAATSSAYAEQFTKPASVFLIDHRQLLAFLGDPQHAAHGALTTDAHIIIADASMLEDTATKAYGHYGSVDDLRAAAQHDEMLTRFTDILAMWMEKVRNNEDTHMLTPGDYNKPETKGLRELLAQLLQRQELPEKTIEQLQHISFLLNETLLNDNLVWCERRQDGALTLLSAPKHVDKLLQVHLYDKFATTLLVPKSTNAKLPEIVPAKTAVSTKDCGCFTPCSVRVSFPTDQSVASVLQTPPSGKTIILIGSKRMVENYFVQQTEALEKQNVTLVCQGFSGGQNRMEAEFLAAPSPAILLITPFMFEGLELPKDTADRLIIESMPFDHPNHTVIGHRKNGYRNGFMDYCLVRVQFRLFRLLRTFCKMRCEGAEVIVLDKRLHEKEYGRTIQHYMAQFATSADIIEPPAPIPVKKPAAKKRVPKKKEQGPQQQLPL